MESESMHRWIVAPFQADREVLWSTLRHDRARTYVMNCHKQLRGPYSGCGDLLRQVVPDIYQRDPDLVRVHATEILSVAPELKAQVVVETETLTSLAIPDERTRFYGRARTLRLAHGLVDFLRKSMLDDEHTPFMLFFENAHAADSLDREFLEVLLRRVKAHEICVVVGTTGDALPDTFIKALTTYTQRVEAASIEQEEFLRLIEAEHISLAWQRWLLQYSGRWHGEWQALAGLVGVMSQVEPRGASWEEALQMLVDQAPAEIRASLATAYIAADGASDNAAHCLAYQLLDVETRQSWHDRRAEELERAGQWSLHLGAIPYHRERGQNIAESAPKALQAALDYCINMGFYEETIALAYRGRNVINWEQQENYYWIFLTKCTTSLAALERAEEAEELYNEARALFSNPYLHMQAAYATAMLYTRHHSTERRNFRVAKGWINASIAIAKLLKDPKESAFYTVFNQNGLALIEVRMGRPQEALRLVTEGLERLNRELGPGEHRLHRSVLVYNRAQVYTTIGQLEQALHDYTAVIVQDPYYSEYYFDRGSIYRSMGRDQEALEDYERAIHYSPPYPEAYYNRAGVLSDLGREDEALADYSYVLELDPEHLDALINRASIYCERGEYEAARCDVERGLALKAGDAQLLCTRGLVAMAEGRNEEAQQAFTAAIEHDTTLRAAWSNRAIIAFERGELEAAISDLSSALALGEDATVLYNRGLAYQAKEQWQQAIDDFSRAEMLSGEGDTQDMVFQRGRCYLGMGQQRQAEEDFAALLRLGNELYVEEISKLMPEFSIVT